MNLADDSRIWIFQANRKFSTEEKDIIISKLKNFIADWNARGDLLLMRNLYTDASACYDSIPKLFPGHTLEDEILMRKASIAKAQNDETAMISYLQEIEDRFSYDIFADKAIFSLAEYYEKKNDIEKAKEKYKKLLLDYPNSMYSQTARTKYRELERK